MDFKNKKDFETLVSKAKTTEELSDLAYEARDLWEDSDFDMMIVVKATKLFPDSKSLLGCIEQLSQYNATQSFTNRLIREFLCNYRIESATAVGKLMSAATEKFTGEGLKEEIWNLGRPQLFNKAIGKGDLISFLASVAHFSIPNIDEFFTFQRKQIHSEILFNADNLFQLLDQMKFVHARVMSHLTAIVVEEVKEMSYKDSIKLCQLVSAGIQMDEEEMIPLLEKCLHLVYEMFPAKPGFADIQNAFTTLDSLAYKLAPKAAQALFEKVSPSALSHAVTNLDGLVKLSLAAACCRVNHDLVDLYISSNADKVTSIGHFWKLRGCLCKDTFCGGGVKYRLTRLADDKGLLSELNVDDFMAGKQPKGAERSTFSLIDALKNFFGG